MSSIHDPRYVQVVSLLESLRKTHGITQKQLAKKLQKPQSYVSKAETGERRLDIVELQDWVAALDLTLADFISRLAWSQTIDASIPALPERESARDAQGGGAELILAWQGKQIPVRITGTDAATLTKVEKSITRMFGALNITGGARNREAIRDALELAVTEMPGANPSDLYHHLVYRLYLREYSRTQADRSWVRAGGEALELFVEQHYKPLLTESGIELVALISKPDKRKALLEMGISDAVGGSKLDVAFYGTARGRRRIFGGMHVKASLAERVSDDVPCSVAMMRKKFASILFTLDVKSFPPPTGDLINRGELGSPARPSDKRNYVEQHGSFTACFSYNLRTIATPNGAAVKSRIFVSSFAAASDPLPKYLQVLWSQFRARRP